MKADYHSDAELEAMLSEFRIVEPKLQCDRGMPISRMCINPECPNSSLMCEEEACQKCGDQNHLQCSTVKLKAVTKLLCDRRQQQKDFILELCKIENNFIGRLHKSKIDLTRKTYLGDLCEKHLSIVQSIYKKNDAKFLTGKEAQAFIKKLRAKDNNVGKNAKRVLETFRQSMERYFSQIISLKSILHEAFTNGSEFFGIESNILKNPLSVNLQEINKKDTIVGEMAIQRAEFLMKALSYPKRLQLLYRGSENEFKAAVFHQKCDNIPNTLTIVRTEFGKTIAGFTQYTWNAVNSGNYVHDAGKHAFLLSLDLKQKMVPISDQHLIYCNSQYGPIFGSGHDLYLSNQCQNNNSQANFPQSYNYEGANKYTNNQDSYQAFSGATNGSTFRVVEYEVFRVVCQQKASLQQQLQLYNHIIKYSND